MVVKDLSPGKGRPTFVEQPWEKIHNSNHASAGAGGFCQKSHRSLAVSSLASGQVVPQTFCGVLKCICDFH